MRPEDFIGIHFFSPVDKMMLVEIIMGEKTGQAALAKALDYVMKIKKTPIVVNDCRGFYTSRCFGTYRGRRLAMLEEGYAPGHDRQRRPHDRHAARPAGDARRRGARPVRQDRQADRRPTWATSTSRSPGVEIVEKMVEELGRYGRKNGKGFYDYPTASPRPCGRACRSWPR